MDYDSELGDKTSGLFYEIEQEKAFHFNRVLETTGNMRPQEGSNKATHLNPQHVLNENQNIWPPHVEASQGNSNDVIEIQLLYDPNAPTKLDLQSGNFHPISLHSSIEQIASDTKSIKDSLNFMVRYIKNKKVKASKINNLSDFDGMGDSIWNFISSIYNSNWNALHTDNKSNSLRTKILSKFTPRILPTNNRSNKEISKPVPISIEKVPLLPPFPAKSKREVNVISKYFQNGKSLGKAKKTNEIKKPSVSYTQTTKPLANTSEVLKIKEAFLALNAKKIDQVNNIIKGNPKLKSCIQMTTKGSSRKQVIIPMSSDNNSIFMKNSSLYIANINRNLKNTKSEVLVNYIWSNPLGITIVTNKISQQSDLQIIDQYVKNSNDINALQVEKPCLPQSKSYLKIIGTLFFPHDNAQDRLTSSDVELILKQNQIFNNITLASRPRVIKVFPKSDIAIVWIDIWDTQSGSNAKMLIKRCFNVGKYIATIQSANMNLGILQCKNCCKWGHTTFSYRIQGAKCIKCNSPHKSENHCKFGWCCKANKNTNPPCFKKKKDKPCPYSFKCSNCQGDHQADSNLCPFWRHRFNRKWQQKKYVKICENRIKSIHSIGSGEPQQ